MPKRDKVGDEKILCESQAPVQTPNLTFTLLLFSVYERQTISLKGSNLTQKKGVNGEVPDVCLRNSEQMQGSRICGNKSAVCVRQNDCVDRACH
jgi:hypothetical protein